MTNPVLFEMLRAGLVESRHRGAFVISRNDGSVVAQAGAIDASVFPRSSYKMMQSLALVESGAADAFGVSDKELALACASHSSEPMHVGAVDAWLRRLGLDDNDLECGPHAPFDDAARDVLIRVGEAPRRAYNNCSGKHAGFLTLAKHLDVSTKGYIAPDLPVQIMVRETISRVCGVAPDAFHAGTDGCAAPNLAMPLRALALGFARMATGEGLDAATYTAARRLFGAQVAYPELMSGTGRACAALISASAGRAVVKTGAEGVYGGLVPDLGLGIALKIDDGAKRASEAAIAALLTALDVVAADDPAVRALTSPPWLNTRGVPVGEGRVTDMLQPSLPATESTSAR